MHGELVSVDHQQHDVEPPPNDVEQEPLKMKRSMDEKKLWDRKERPNENTLKNEEERQSKKARLEVTQLLDEKELLDEKQLMKEHGTLADNKDTRLGGGKDNGELSDVAQKYGTTPGTASAVFPRLGYAMTYGANINSRPDHNVGYTIQIHTPLRSTFGIITCNSDNKLLG